MFEDLKKRATYALISKNRDLVMEAYGMAKFALATKFINYQEFWVLNEMLIRDGINNPEAKLH